MSIDTSARMIIGIDLDDRSIDWPDDKAEREVGEYLEDKGMVYASPWFDASDDFWIIGYAVKGCDISDIDAWVADVKDKAATFKDLFGVDASLIVSPDVC
jgi:hypothetical protein